MGKTKRGKGTKIMAVADRSGLPVAISVSSASPHEITFVELTLETMFTAELPKRLIGDKAYDSDSLDEKLAKNGMELIAPHRSNRKNGRPRMGESYAVIVGVGKWSACLHGIRIIGASWFALIALSRTTSAMFIWVAW